MRLSSLLKKLRAERGISQLQLADFAGVNRSVVHRAARGGDAKLATWEKLFWGVGHDLEFDTIECSEEEDGLQREECERRRQRRLAGLNMA